MPKGEKQINRPSMRMLELGRHGLGTEARELAQKVVIEAEAVTGREWKNRKDLEKLGTFVRIGLNGKAEAGKMTLNENRKRR